MGKSFLDLFIERDVDNKEQESVQSTTAAPNGTTVFAQKPAQPQQQTQEPTDKTAGSDDAIVDKLFQTLVDNNLPGPDYLELKHNASNLAKYVKGEAEQYCAAYDVLKGSYPKLTKDVILASIDKYKIMMESERKKGLEEANAAIAQADNSAEIAALREDAAKIETKIKELSIELEKKRQLADTKQTVMDSRKLEIEHNKVVFNASVDKVISVLDADKQMIAGLNI